ncbi:MAG: hypothetical protein JSU68_14090, partial [Phycisphaerales bacterium]
MRFAPWVLILVCASAVAGAELPENLSPETLTAEQVQIAVGRATDFLLKDQNADGSWGSHRNAAHEFWSNPETHRSWTVATTGLCCMALREVGLSEATQAAYEHGLDYLISNALVKRPSDWDVDNTWAYVYGLQALARAAADRRPENPARREQIRGVAQSLLAK